MLNPDFARLIKTHGKTQSPTKGPSVAWLAWALVSMFYAYQFLLRVLPSVMVGDLMQRFQIDAATFGQFSGVYYLSYSAAHVPIGLMLDRFGPRRVLVSCLLIALLGVLPLIMAELWVYPVVGRVLTGLGSSAAILGVFKVIHLVFAERYFTRMLSFSVTIGLLGGIYGGGPVRYLCGVFTPEAVVQGIICVGLILAAATFWIMPDTAPSRPATSRKKRSPLSDVRLVLSNRRVLILCLFAGLMVGPLEGFADIWGPEFLRRTYGLDATLASYLTSTILLGMCFGAPVLSLVAEKLQDHLGVVIGSGIVMCAVFVALVGEMLSPALMLGAFVVVGVCCSYQILVVYKSSTYVPSEVAGLTNAVANMIMMSFGYLLHATIGFVIERAGGAHIPGAFAAGVSVIPWSLGLGVVGLIGLYIFEKISSRARKTAPTATKTTLSRKKISTASGKAAPSKKTSQTTAAQKTPPAKAAAKPNSSAKSSARKAPARKTAAISTKTK